MVPRIDRGLYGDAVILCASLSAHGATNSGYQSFAPTTIHIAVISALELLKGTKTTQHYYSPNDKIFINGVLKSGWRDLIVEIDKDGLERVNRVNYEISVLKL